MSHVWCHGPNCHTYATQDRVRGSKGSKVLRTRKVRLGDPNYRSMYSYFCSQGCYNEFANAHVEQIIRIAPRIEPLETRIKDPTKDTNTTAYGHTYTHLRIKRLDEESGVG
tara:strand:+ start:198 stop:530 length:333 start_codon:yes stop_codon:yes gene_type:complete